MNNTHEISPFLCILLIHSKDNYSFCETAFFGSLAIRIPQTGIGEQQRDRGDRERHRESHFRLSQILPICPLIYSVNNWQNILAPGLVSSLKNGLICQNSTKRKKIDLIAFAFSK